MLNQLPGVPFSPRAGFAPEVHEVVGIIVAIAHDVVLGVVQQWHEFREEPVAALGGELVVETPHAGADGREEVVYIFTWGKPVLAS